MNKPIKLIVGILILLLTILFLPLPYYQKDSVVCKPGQTACPQLGWHWSKSLVIQIWQTVVLRLNQSEITPVALSPEQVCQRGNYKLVQQCGQYFIGIRPCCDQGADILNNKGDPLASCGGLPPPPPASSVCPLYEKVLKKIDLSSCQDTPCLQKCNPVTNPCDPQSCDYNPAKCNQPTPVK